MLDKNKKFRVIEEGVMSRGEMGMIKGGEYCTTYQCETYDYWYCKTNDIRYMNPCPDYVNPFCPEIDSYASCALNESYHFCPGKLDYFDCMEGMYHGR